MTDNLPETKFSRARVAGKTLFKMGSAHLSHKVKRPFLSKQKQQQEQGVLDEKQAKLFYSALTQLRGTALKLAQMLRNVHEITSRY